MLSALELARQARIAANRAYLSSLGLGAAAMHGGGVPALLPASPTVLVAAREVAHRAALEQAKRQVRWFGGREWAARLQA